MNKKFPILDILSGSVYRKHIAKGGKLASSFEIIYGRKPPISVSVNYRSPVVTFEAHNNQYAKIQLQRMMNLSVRRLPHVNEGDFFVLLELK